MGKICTGNKKNAQDQTRGDFVKPRGKMTEQDRRRLLSSGSITSKTTTTRETDQVMNRPDLGIYDTRAWDAQYLKWAVENGERPGKHPDPNCDWNTDNYKAFNYQ